MVERSRLSWLAHAQRTRLLVLYRSRLGEAPWRVIRHSLPGQMELMFCSSKIRRPSRQLPGEVQGVTVLRAKRETDLARIMSIFPCLHWRIIRRNSFRLQVEVR